jgi:hypothetical protein
VLVGLIVAVSIYMYSGRAHLNTPIYKGVEHIASKYHEQRGEWPRSYAELKRFASPDDFRHIDHNFNLAGIKADFDATADHLAITYTGPNYTIVRYAWEEDGNYRSGLSMDERGR